MNLLKSRPWHQQPYLRLSILLAVLVLAAALILLSDELGRLVPYRRYGYLGVFLATLISSAAIILPLPGALAVVAGGAALNPFLVALIAGVGEPLGELTGYLAGYGSRDILERRRGYRRMEELMRRYGGLAIFFSSVIPNPLFDIMGATAGALRYPLWKFLLLCWAGKTLKALGLASLGALGIRLLTPWGG